MLFTTFFSYKGGVGRTLALVNSAKMLSKEGKNVFLIDLDLEAPGIDSYIIFKPEKPHLGVVDYITEYLKTSKLPDINNYFYKIKKESEQDGEIYIMPAGLQNDEYSMRLHNINWQYIYSKKDGYNFIENFKEQIENLGNIDYTLIDSRTGFCDISGISTHQLADVVVLIFNLNEQNVQGIISAYNSIIKSEKKIEIILTISPLPTGTGLNEIINDKFISLQKSMKAAFNSGIDDKRKPVIISYDPFLAINDIIISNFDESKMPLVSQFESYKKLVDYIKLLNKEEYDSILKTALDYKISGRYELAEKELEIIIEKYPDNSKGLFEYANVLALLNQNDKAIGYLKKTIALNPKEYDYVIFTINTLIRNKRYDEALQYLEIADKIKPDYPEHFFIRGKICYNQGKYEEANKYNEKALRESAKQKPKKTDFSFEALRYHILNDKKINWGRIDKIEFFRILEEDITITYQSKIEFLQSIFEGKISINNVENIYDTFKKIELFFIQLFGDDYKILTEKIKNKELDSINDESGLLYLEQYTQSGKYIFSYLLANFYNTNKDFEKSIKYFEKSINAKPSYFVYSDWGIALLDLGKKIISDDKGKGNELFEQSFEKFMLAVKYREDYPEAYFGWGTALSNLGKIINSDDKEKGKELFEQSFEKFMLAVKYREDYPDAYNNWGNALLNLGKIIISDDKEKGKELFEQSFEKYELAVKYKEDYLDAYYNWGIALAELGKIIISGDKEKGKELFEQSIEKYELAVKYKEDYSEAYNNLGIAKIHLWYSEKDNNLLNSVIEISLKGEAILKYSCMYNLACAYSLLKDKKNALHYLSEIIKVKPDLKKWAREEDKDWLDFRNDEEFIAITQE